jgi:dTDP-4-dehydrorhamnose 3,5-epimerase
MTSLIGNRVVKLNSVVHLDERGSFHEFFRISTLKSISNEEKTFKQSNISYSTEGVIRGLHVSNANSGQEKLVTCIHGEILDFVIDLDPNSKTFLESSLNTLSGGDGQSILMGKGIGHAFLALRNSIVNYVVTEEWDSNNESSINPFSLNEYIRWPESERDFIISKKDAEAISLDSYLEKIAFI